MLCTLYMIAHHMHAPVDCSCSTVVITLVQQEIGSCTQVMFQVQVIIIEEVQVA